MPTMKEIVSKIVIKNYTGTKVQREIIRYGKCQNSKIIIKTGSKKWKH